MQDELLPADLARAITDPGAFAERGRMEEVFAWIRANNPLGRAIVPGFQPFWVVSRYHDVSEVSRRTDCFNSTSRPLILMTDENLAHMAAINDGEEMVHRSMALMDDPLHRRHRALFDDWFHPNKVKRLEGRVERIAAEFVDRLVAHGGACEFVEDIASRYTVRIMMDIIGVPQQDEPTMLALADALYNEAEGGADIHDAGPQSIDAKATAELQRQSFDALKGYFEALTEQRRGCPATDLATILAGAEVDGAPLHPLDRFGHYVSFATAGHHTSASTLAGGVWLLAERPDLFAALKADPALLPAFIEELLRRISPAKHFMRGCVKATELRGRRIEVGDWLYLSFPSANHDEEVFPDPFEFRLDRKPNRHLAFGIGPHHCVGQSLARMELRNFFELMLKRLDSLELDGPCSLTRGRFVQGPRRIPIRYQAA